MKYIILIGLLLLGVGFPLTFFLSNKIPGLVLILVSMVFIVMGSMVCILKEFPKNRKEK